MKRLILWGFVKALSILGKRAHIRHRRRLPHFRRLARSYFFIDDHYARGINLPRQPIGALELPGLAQIRDRFKIVRRAGRGWRRSLLIQNLLRRRPPNSRRSLDGLHRLAVIAARRHESRIPRSPRSLKELPMNIGKSRMLSPCENRTILEKSAPAAPFYHALSRLGKMIT